ncbi:Transposase, IS4 family protein [Mycobacterium intracellulare subsp. intracellulare MTCC 9506]|uniref:Transposase, IS4 family protein n=1 Tax=Mycobacterium indicus pranii (strain DSM 45239 / MTCC 9506) TaxID=1232724 RepID=J9WIS6_MYCIP|nr:Transposase, IS4 family protein [Mycobacterium intracellulare subsp. intracellulare MTCC 9506]AFS13330.1 Transposase, IS4 family protein [Mycobacterium intracellulare subsp. intracellulare MTCC 9506]AFS15742.1 Transposase, IS4 family protein [Mycobacterium intracellulare subsp. intracellulare MTCC 9506]AFS16068.1 Transposase, IS4 family protein [Mycobacterium intracellulare subsp. intracellulare MTCC 9506]
MISSTGAALLVQTAQVSGLTSVLSDQLRSWRAPRSVHDPGKMVLDLAVAIALGGDCLADAALLRAQPELFGAVASDPTISRLLETLGGDPAAAIAAIRHARASARATVWQLCCPVPVAGEVVVDLDATLIGAHSDKEGATPNFKRGYGFHPMMAFVDHGAGGTGEPLAAMLRPGRANASDAADQIAVLDAALAQLPQGVRDRVLVRGDTGSGVKEFLWHIHHLGLSYSVGVYGRQPVLDALAALPRQAWRRAKDADGCLREGAQVAELTRWLPATFVGWPPGMRVIARRERPHPGAQLRITDAHGWRITMFATNTTGGRLADLEVRHRLRARAEDRIRTLKDTGLANLPLQAFGKNEIWLELAALAYELLTWTQLLAWPDHPARSWEPKRLRLRLLSVAGRVITTGRRRILRLSRRWPWSELLTRGQRNLAALN